MPRGGKVWMLDPHSGGVKIPETVKKQVRERIEAYAAKKYKGKYKRLDFRFRGPLCFIDAYLERTLAPGWPPKNFPETRDQMLERLRNTPIHLCRMRYFGNEDRWSLAFFTYSNERYTPCVFRSGEFFGTPEEAFDVGATYLNEQ